MFLHIIKQINNMYWIIKTIKCYVYIWVDTNTYIKEIIIFTYNYFR